MSRLVAAFLFIVLGTAVGYCYGRFIAPVQYVDVDLPSLRVDYRSDYVLMVAERYAADRDFQDSSRRLALLASQSPERVIAEAIRFGQSASYSADDIALLQDLLRASQEQSLAASTPEAYP